MQLSRRRFIASTSFAAAAAWTSPHSLFAQAANSKAQPEVVIQGRATAANAKITTQPLRGNVSALMGSGGNIAVLPGKEGKLIVDSGISTSQPQLTAALAAISGDPITRLINTHWHYDHTDGNEWMHNMGATIIAQENTRERLSKPQTIAAFNATFPAAPAGAIPTSVFGKTQKIKVNGATLQLAHYDPAHTDTDISIYFVEANVLHTGDTWFNGFYPFIDYSTGGNINGMITATERNLAMANPATIVIPGHGPIGDKAALTRTHEMLVACRDAVSALKKQGKSLPDVVAAKPTAAYDDTWGAGFMKPEAFIGLVYQGV
jgi:glyoxylase-like metal-dependent hydrolase (beta-lactamase superfamily II)